MATFSNHEIVTLAVYLLGGESKMVDTEDVAIKANGLAPGRFSWRKYADQINIENVRTFLSDAKKPKNGHMLIGSGKEGWMLTEEGREFAVRRMGEIQGADLARTRHTTVELQWMNRERNRMLVSEAFEKFKGGKSASISDQEAEAFFRLDDYVRGKARERRILRLLNTFGDDAELGDAVAMLAQQLKFKEEAHANGDGR